MFLWISQKRTICTFSHHPLWLKWIPPPSFGCPCFALGRGSPHVLQTQQDPDIVSNSGGVIYVAAEGTSRDRFLGKVPSPVSKKSAVSLFRSVVNNCVMGHCLFGLLLSLLLPFSYRSLEWRKGKQNDASSGILNQAAGKLLPWFPCGREGTRLLHLGGQKWKEALFPLQLPHRRCRASGVWWQVMGLRAT